MILQSICYIMDRERTRDKVQDQSKQYVDLYNLPQHGNKEDISYFIWKALEKSRALTKHTNPITRSQMINQLNCVRLHFRTREETINCLDLNGIFYGERSFYMKSPLAARLTPQIQIASGLNIRRISPKVEEGFNKLCIFNLPDVKQYEVINFLIAFGELKSFSPILSGQTLTQCYFEYQRGQDTENCLQKVAGARLKGKQVTIKRAALMADTAKGALVKSRPKTSSSFFEKDSSSYYLTFDTVGFFKNMKISCVLLFRGVISSNSQREFIKEDMRKELSKIGPITKMAVKDKNLYCEYERVQYAQICFLILLNRKYDGKSIDVVFYDPLSFADDILA